MENSVLIVIIKYNEKVNGNVHNKSYQLIVKVPGSYPDCDRNSIFLSSYTDFIQSIVMGYLTVVPKRYFWNKPDRFNTKSFFSFAVIVAQLIVVGREVTDHYEVRWIEFLAFDDVFGLDFRLEVKGRREDEAEEEATGQILDGGNWKTGFE